MPRVKFHQAIRFNLSGYDRMPHVFDAGEHEVSERVAEFVARNPSVGAVLPATEQQPSGAETTPPPASDDLSSLTVAELRERARATGIEGAGSMKKAELVAALLETDPLPNPPQTGAGESDQDERSEEDEESDLE